MLFTFRLLLDELEDGRGLPEEDTLTCDLAGGRELADGRLGASCLVTVLVWLLALPPWLETLVEAGDAGFTTVPLEDETDFTGSVLERPGLV